MALGIAAGWVVRSSAPEFLDCRNKAFDVFAAGGASAEVDSDLGEAVGGVVSAELHLDVRSEKGGDDVAPVISGIGAQQILEANVLIHPGSWRGGA